MQASVKWKENLTLEGTSETGHTLTMDGCGGQNGPTPMELVLLAAGGCSSIDVVSILEKARQDVTDCQVKIDADRAETTPRVFTRIHLHFEVTGKGLSEKHVQRAVDLSMEKYCSVSLMLGKHCPIEHSYSVIEAA